MIGEGRARAPRVGVETRAWVPGAVLRVLGAVAPPAVVLAALSRSTLPFDVGTTATVGTIALLAWGLWRPGHGPSLTAIATAALLAAFTWGSGPDVAALWLAPLGYGALRLSNWAGAVGWGSRVELGALGRPALRDAVVMAATLLVGALGLTVRGSSPAVLVAGAGALLALAWWVLGHEDDG
ncbi:hypothetical protein ET495_04585 [Xylanimonas allomyrinae]|uniref:Uncharacterized protein n=1 Tax=Xylanimonas allomyrinae TaxID=2509459 RepID=A0A4P6EJG4_9MICO|nr:hypothetical protein [Xylanimonas allomyrinae]QAY62654.1 hypothetical protein ET495_04585 [Xylanimonas allomyrinae]